MQAVQKFACQGVLRSIWLLNVSLLNLTLDNDSNEEPILLPCLSPLSHSQTPSLLLAPFFKPTLLPMLFLPVMSEKKEKSVICRKIKMIDIAADFSSDSSAASHHES